MTILSEDVQEKWSVYTSPPVHPILFGEGRPACAILRLDLIRSWTSGNKYYKLKYALADALEQGITTIVSKGGMFSNHLAALSDACSTFGIHLIAVIRSHSPDESNPSIQKLRADGVEILYTSPAVYKSFDQAESAESFPGALFIPEGGLSEEGIKGASEIAMECLEYKPTHVILAGGTMGTACGLLANMPDTIKVIIVPAWKGCRSMYMTEILNRFKIYPVCAWELWPQFHFGGFGKYDSRLIDFMSSFSSLYDMPLDPVYTGKLMYAIHQKVGEGYFIASDRILALHSGGIQGIEGYRYRFPGDWGKYLNLATPT